MKASRLWILAFTFLAIASTFSSDVVCTLSDSETSGANMATGYVPSVWTRGSVADFQLGTVVGTDRVSSPGSVILDVKVTAPSVYALVGGGSTSFYRFNATAGTWAPMAPLPAGANDGTDLVFDGSRFVYAILGGSTSLYRYDVLSNSWALYGTAPSAIGVGGSVARDGTNLYVLRGSTGQDVFRVDLTTGSWSRIAMTPQLVGSGASLAALDGSLYITRGGGTSAFWRFDLNTSSWATLANALGNIGGGADILITPAGMVYSSYGGSNNRKTERYSPATNSWTALASQAVSVKDGGSIAFDGSDTIYSTGGDSKPNFYKYSVSANIWTPITSLPAGMTVGGCIEFVPALRVGYRALGTFTSETFDTGTPGMRYVQAFWDRNLPASTMISLEARASDTLSSGVPASSWQSLGSATSGTMSGLTGRYVQWRAVLTTADGSVTPELQEVRLYYYHA